MDTRNRISSGTELLMGGVAWAVYGVNFLVNLLGDLFGIGEIVSFIFMVAVVCAFIFWFATKSVSVFNSKIIGAVGWMIILSIIPIVNVFAFTRSKKDGLPRPTIRGIVSKIIEIVRKEDEEYNLKQEVKRQNERPSNVIQGNFRPTPQKEMKKAA